MRGAQDTGAKRSKLGLAQHWGAVEGDARIPESGG